MSVSIADQQTKHKPAIDQVTIASISAWIEGVRAVHA